MDSCIPRSPAPDHYRREIRIALVALAFTWIAWGAVSWEILAILGRRLAAGDWQGAAEQGLFVLVVEALLYGNFVYQLTRLAYLRRRLAHRPLPPAVREAVYGKAAPSLAILVPAYREELAVMRRTLLSAALQDYPGRRVVLLLDDPPAPADPGDAAALAAARRLPRELQAHFDGLAAPFLGARAEFLARCAAAPLDRAAETLRLARHYQDAAAAVAALAGLHPVADHADRLLHERVLAPAAAGHRDRAAALAAGHPLGRRHLAQAYHRLAELFRVELTSFERKAYANLSHQPNKAMNLNSYIGLMGGSWRQAEGPGGPWLEAAPAGSGDFAPPAADFLLTLDADSILVPEYAATLVAVMGLPGNARLAVAQTPYNAIPGAPGRLEQLAGATTDIQYLIHQGFTAHGATFWVGANALLRTAALADIRHEVVERGYRVPVFVQDRTVIEDTESSVDLAATGWRLYNHPERLAYSATPPDFGALLIQRRRWANGGLIILPKLLRYLAAPVGGQARFAEGFFRVHYLASIAAVSLGLLVLLGHAFETSVESAWLPLTAVPYFALYARDLRYSGYRARDTLAVYALNLLLLPVNLGGVLKSLQQGITGQRVPFGRTPKVSGRTAVPAGYLLAEFALLAAWLLMGSADLEQGRWAGACFHIGNGLVLAYAIQRFIGFAASREDLRRQLPWLALGPVLFPSSSPRPPGAAEGGRA